MRIKFIVIFILPFFCSNIWAQNIDKKNLSKPETNYWDYKKTKKRSMGYYYVDALGKTGKKHGKWKYWDKKGDLTETRTYNKGKIGGEVTLFYATGARKQTGYFKNGERDSTLTVWFKDSSLMRQGLFDMGQKVGLWYDFYKDGDTMQVAYYQDSVEHIVSFWDYKGNHTLENGDGLKETFFSFGSLKKRYNYKDSLKHGSFIEKNVHERKQVSGQYRHNKKIGDWTFWFFTGEVQKKLTYKNDLLDGAYVEYYDNGKKLVEGHFDTGDKVGLWIWYTNEEKVDMKGHFDSDLQDGLWTYFYPTGEKNYYGSYDKGEKTGTWTFLYKNGETWKKGHYMADQRHGDWKFWYENGQVLKTGQFEYGEEVGEWKNWYENGQIKNVGHFDDGKLDGEWLSYYPDGVKKLKGEYKDNFKSGDWKEYYPDGKPKHFKSFKVKTVKNKVKEGSLKGLKRKKSVPDGEWIEFREDGSKLSVGDYDDGKKDGEWTYYHPQGRVVARTVSYKNGKLDGWMKSYSWGRNSHIKRAVEYKDDLRDGKYIVYDEKGEIKVEKEFKQGRRVRENNSGGHFKPPR